MAVKPMLEAAEAKRAKKAGKLDELLAKPQTEERNSLTAEEAAEFEKLSTDITEIDKQIGMFRAQLEREEKAAAASGEVRADAKPEGGATVLSEPRVYDRLSRSSYLKDLAYRAVATKDPNYLGMAEEATERMSRHMRELEVEARHDKEIAGILAEYRQTPASLEQRTNPNTTAGTGGEFVPPLWLVSQYVKYVRPGRIFANRVQNQALPPGIDIINIPKITVGSQAAIQTANAAPVVSVDIQTSTVSARVNTIAGQEDISLQLLEQSPLSMDGVVFDDLSRDYDQRLDLQVIAGTGTNGQHKGVLSVAGGTSNTSITQSNFVSCTSTTFHDSSTSATQYRSVVNGVNQIETLRFDAPTGIWVHPRRSNSWAYASDSTNRPLFIPAKYGQFNALGTNEGQPVPQGVAGELFGLPVVKDANMTTVANGFSGSAVTTTGGTQDPVIVLKEDDLILWEGTMRMRALPEILSGTLQIRFQVYAYSAFMPDRFPPSISVVTGTGTAAPGF